MSTDAWRNAKSDPPQVGQLVLAYFKQPDTYWAGHYIGQKQSFDSWQAITEHPEK